MQSRHFVIAALALAAASLPAAGCGGGGSTPAVANIGTSTSTTSSGGSSSGNSNGSEPSPKDAASFSACMRSHGVRNFPDPSNGGELNIGPNSGIDPNSATFKAAEKACQKKLNITPPSPEEQAKMQEQALKFSACMRSHGVPKFPDPQFSGGTARLKLDRKSGIDPKSPVFRAAMKACEKELPGIGKEGPDEQTRSGGGTTGS